MSNYNLEGNRFLIEDYDKVPAFSSFLPGLTGVTGIPVWSFYTNRGQGINSFGIHHKGNAIMEFNSANTAYENTPVKGFRTFIRVNGTFFEPFCSYSNEAKRRMEIGKNTFSIQEKSHDLTVDVRYMTLPGENIGALVRQVKITNEGSTAIDLEYVDGMPQIIPFGIQNGQYKEMSNLFKSWADIRNIENHAPVYAMRASSDDSAEVKEIQGGYFYCGVADGRPVPVIYDKESIFAYDNSMVTPVAFVQGGLQGVLAKEQCFANKVPCGFLSGTATLQPGESLTFAAFSGYTPSEELLNEKVRSFCKEGYVDAKFAEAEALVESFTADVRTHSGSPLFDQYVEQCYLDNFLRGGYPYVIGEGDQKSVLHLFSRKHGDPERDYNFFSIAGEYYSQGNGNYRDVCQNRRNDVYFKPAMEDFNIRCFYSLIQMDGYNPLEIRPTTFAVKAEQKQTAKALIESAVEKGADILLSVIAKPFTPGQITGAIAGHSLKVKLEESSLVEQVLALCEQRVEAGFGEGYWSDHWDYNLDLVENYLKIYPENKKDLLFGRQDYRYYDSVGVVRPRSDTYVIKGGQVRQYGSMEHCAEKAAREGFDEKGTNWLKDNDGNTITTSLFGKMLTLAVNKFALLDSKGLGVEMEGGKPGWNDAMNGLPGLFGSSMPETIELKRLVDFMLVAVKEASEAVTVPVELADFMTVILDKLDTIEFGSFAYWDAVATEKERFREAIKFTASGKTRTLTAQEISKVLTIFAEKLDQAIDNALALGDGIMPTYFTYEAAKWEEVKNPDGTARISPYGLPSAKVTEFKLNNLPHFLEGPAKLLTAWGGKNRDKAALMYQNIKASDLYDKPLKMYKTSESIEGLSMENGRVRAFTPGWLERESVFLHMEYKYFYGLLRSGFYKEFYEAIGDALIPWQKPEVYGRSILENSSFIASSANPDPMVHGRGFVARLSGSTVEMLSMWIGMFMGEGGFALKDGKLVLTFAPLLAGTMFDQAGDASFTLCGGCKVTYHNPAKADTFGDGVKVTRMVFHEGDKEIKVEGDTADTALALGVREGRIHDVDVFLA